MSELLEFPAGPVAATRDGARDRAVAEQAEASDPAVSAFVEASAGSGKTKLLTDRILRLMLGGAPPDRIQCLTFTKAAAAEMALRLQGRLGEWVTLEDAVLDARLRDLGVEPDDDTRRTARALFADVLDLPGGMRIGTIHAFCQGLLRRFPLEAALSPHFRLLDDAEAETAMRAARDTALENADPAAVAAVAGLLRADDFAARVRQLQAAGARLAPLLSRPAPARAVLVRRAAGTEARGEAEVIEAAVSWPGDAALDGALRILAAKGTDKMRLRACAMTAWLSMSPAARAAQWDDWAGQFLDAKGEPRKFGTFPTDKIDRMHPEIRDALVAEQERVFFVEDARRAVRCAAATNAMLDLAAPALGAYAAGKDRAGLLDYADLIARTERLLQDPGAAWVLYKLDGGIDHLLLDEVQDTAPEQWHIAHRLTEEFFAGQGARYAARGDAGHRTFFAVGDPKQSIYSFQGADPAEFVDSRKAMAERVMAAGQGWRDVALDVSFRSTAPVLALVDAVFADAGAADGVVSVPGSLRHHAERAGAAGSVELWPLAPAAPAEESAPWTLPIQNLPLVSAPQRVADGIAAAIATELERGARLESRGRAVQPGDYLVLVRSRERGGFARALVRALKARGVPVAGMDRLRLTEQLAVQDVLSACDAVLLPEDDLAVATVLTSPLGGLSDDGLMELAMARGPVPLRTVLDRRAHERPEWGRAAALLHHLAARADFVTPHALLAELLGPLGGRAALLARLGAEAAEPLDELLNAALSYVRLHPPSLQGFVHWLRRSGAEVKREAGAAGSAVRIMTAHGAKGLQAPVVILPDTTGLPPANESFFWREAGGVEVPLWSPRKPMDPRAVAQARQETAAARQREYNRLLYVALTRAEDRLVVCGWEPRTPVPDTSWYAAVSRGFGRLGAEARPFDGGWDGDILVRAAAQAAPPRPDPAREAAGAADPLPRWAGHPGHWRPEPPPEEPVLPRPLAPSRPAGAAFGPVPPAASPLVRAPGPRFARGNAVHTLLQHLPDLPEADRAAAAERHLLAASLDPATRAELLHQVEAVLAHPALAPLFGPDGRAEQPLAGLVGGRVVSGVVDRMAVLPDRVLLADFKTGRPAPAEVSATPGRYLAQLAAYRAVLRALFPGRAVECALVWTEGAAVTPIPDALLDVHAPTSGTAA